MLFASPHHKLLALEILFSERKSEKDDPRGICPPADHQHIRAHWVSDTHPDITIHTIGQPDNPTAEWTIHPETQDAAQHNAMQHAVNQLREMGLDAQVITPDQLQNLPSEVTDLLPQTSNTEEDLPDEPGGMYL